MRGGGHLSSHAPWVGWRVLLLPFYRGKPTKIVNGFVLSHTEILVRAGICTLAFISPGLLTGTQLFLD